LAHACDVAVVAPATANILAKLALGIADDLVTSTLLEATCPLVVAPAMHTGMWEHPATRSNLSTLVARGATVVGPAEGALAAGDEGMGRMAAPEEIAAAVGAALGPDERRRDLDGTRILVTAGPTYEPIDPVRFLGNRSTGKMGYGVAAEAARRGAAVTLVSGPVSLDPPEGVDVVDVETAEEMADAVMHAFPTCDAVVMAAAVADFRPAEAAGAKIKKSTGPPELRLVPTVDILATLGERRAAQVLVGFAAETAGVDAVMQAEGRRKLAAKGVDLMVVNEVGRVGTGFGADTDRAAILAAGGEDTPLRDWTKAELAAAICDRIAALTHGGR
jgi:phosphopantothenoylcysteine decarboxylase/phosphopantothenate--cysteine ligase